MTLPGTGNLRAHALPKCRRPFENQQHEHQFGLQHLQTDHVGFDEKGNAHHPMQMSGLNVMITISKYWKHWSNPHLIVLVLNNRDLNQVTWEERIMLDAKNFVSMIPSEPELGSVLKNSAKELLAGVLPAKGR